MTVTTHPLAEDYIRRLERAARALPCGQREELLAEIRAHLDAGLAPDATEADVRNLLDRLGSPADIVAAARPAAAPSRGAREVFSLLFLVTGFPPVLGWLVGAGLLVWSPSWSPRQKTLGLLVWPGGYVLVAALAAVLVAALPSVFGVAAVALLLAAPLVVAAYLFRAAGRRAGVGGRSRSTSTL